MHAGLRICQMQGCIVSSRSSRTTETRPASWQVNFRLYLGCHQKSCQQPVLFSVCNKFELCVWQLGNYHGILDMSFLELDPGTKLHQLELQLDIQDVTIYIFFFFVKKLPRKFYYKIDCITIWKTWFFSPEFISLQTCLVKFTFETRLSKSSKPMAHFLFRSSRSKYHRLNYSQEWPESAFLRQECMLLVPFFIFAICSHFLLNGMILAQLLKTLP